MNIRGVARRLVTAARKAVGKATYRVRRRVTRTIASAAPEQPTLRRLLPAELLELADSSDAHEITTHRAHYVIARRQADVTRWQLAAQTATAVAECLERAGVPFFAMHLPATRTARWGVRRQDLATVIEAIAGDLGGEGFYYHARELGLPRPVTHPLAAEELDSVRDITCFQYVRCTTIDKLYGAPDGCRIGIWDDHEDRATLVAPDRQSIVQEIDRSDPLPLTTRPRWDGWPEPCLSGSTADASAIDFPVDAVYLWVDDSDPRWREKRAAVRRRLGLAEPSGAGDTHYFRDRGELRASLRSLQAHAPWIRHVYLVTDEQSPDWLDTQHGRVSVVDHREIFSDTEVLPSYSSHAIGSQVHRIPGLSDHYLILNDDVMFTAPVTPYDFFTPSGQLRVFFSRSRRPAISREHQNPLEQARSNSAELIHRDYGRRASEVFAHVPIAQRKDVAAEVAQRYAQEIAVTLRSPFRSATDVESNSWLHLYTALFTGRGVRSALRYGYFNTGDPQVRERLVTNGYPDNVRVICLNDVPPPGGEDDADPGWLTDWLARTFPIAAPFELPATPTPDSPAHPSTEHSS